MKATINELWDTGMQVLSFDNSEFERPFDVSDLKECDNVIILNEKHPHLGRLISIDGEEYFAKHVRVKNIYFDFYGVEIFEA